MDGYKLIGYMEMLAVTVPDKPGDRHEWTYEISTEKGTTYIKIDKELGVYIKEES